MRTLRFEVERAVLGGRSDAVELAAGDDPYEVFRDAIWEAVRLDVYVTIGGVTQPAALWEDPEHWAEDWARELGVELDAAAATVAGILGSATEEGA